MEIVDYIRVAKRRKWIILLVPLLSTIAAASYVLFSPVSYAATTTISTSGFIGASWSQYTGPQATAQFAAAFAQAAQGPTVIMEVAKKVKLDPTTLLNGLTVTQLGSSSDMTVTYQSSENPPVAAVASAVAKQTLAQMFQPQVKLAQTQADSALKAVSSANANLTALFNKYGIADPTAAYTAALNQLNALQQQQSTLQADGKTVQAATLDAAIAMAKTQVSQFSPLLDQFRQLQATQQSAQAILGRAQDSLRNATTQSLAANDAQVLYTGDGQEVSRVSLLILVVVPVFAASLFVTILVIAILEMLPMGRHSRTRRSDAQPSETISEGVELGDPVVSA